jgi:hypothetical protein
MTVDDHIVSLAPQNLVTPSRVSNTLECGGGSSMLNRFPL